MFSSTSRASCLHNWCGAAVLLVLTSTVPILPILNAQSGNLAGSENAPVRITVNPKIPLIGGPQMPPYQNMATFLRNAYLTPDDGMVLLQDSSVCSMGEPGTGNFEPFLQATYSHSDGLLDEIIFWQVDMGDRRKFSRKQFDYEDARLARYRYDTWDDVMGDWQPDTREMIHYNDAARQDSSVQQKWMGSDWRNGTLLTTEFNDDNRPMESKISVLGQRAVATITTVCRHLQ